MSENQLFIDRFEPNKIQNFVLPQRIKDAFITQGDELVELSGNYLFYGTQGCGKSSLAKMLAKNYRHLYVNAAISARIDYLREVIDEFVNVNQIVTEDEIIFNKKVIILDEVGQVVSDTFWEGLKGFMDIYQDKVTFIFTTNHFHKVPEPIKSRCEKINFNHLNAEEEMICKAGYISRFKAIVNKVGIEFVPEDLERIHNKFFPDFRQTLIYLQSLSKSGIKSLSAQSLQSFDMRFVDVFNLILEGKTTSPEEIHKIITQQYSVIADEIITSMDEKFVGYLMEKDRDKYLKYIPEIIILTADYSFRQKMSVDGGICLKALIFSIIKLLNN